MTEGKAPPSPKVEWKGRGQHTLPTPGEDPRSGPRAKCITMARGDLGSGAQGSNVIERMFNSPSRTNLSV